MKEKIKVLIVGNGFGGTYTLKGLHQVLKDNPHVELTLIGEKNYFLFTPLLHEIATGGINPQNILEPIRKVLGHCMKNFYLGKVEFIDLKKQEVTVADNKIHYDYLVLAPGARTNFYDTHNAEKYCFTLKSVEDAIKLRNHCVTQMERASHTTNSEERQKILRFVVIGGGPTGVELATELQEYIKDTFSYYYNKEIIDDASIILIDRGTRLVSSFGLKVSDRSLQIVKDKGIEVMLNTSVLEVDAGGVRLADGTNICTETAIWVAGIKPAQLNFDTEVEKSPEGQLIVNEYLQITGHENVFAIGDVASFKQNDSPLPALAQVAEGAAWNVSENIERMIHHKKLQPFTYTHKGYLLSLGKWMAIGSMAGITFSGHLTWLLWRLVYLSKLISFRRKVEVFTYWTINLFSPRDISQI